MMPKVQKLTAVQSRMIHVGMVMTIGSVIAVQFVQSGAVEFALVALALIGIVLSIAPLLASDDSGWWAALRQKVRDADADDDLWECSQPTRTRGQGDDEERDD